jgi:hypothetical protein
VFFLLPPETLAPQAAGSVAEEQGSMAEESADGTTTSWVEKGGEAGDAVDGQWSKGGRRRDGWRRRGLGREEKTWIGAAVCLLVLSHLVATRDPPKPTPAH